VKRVLSGENSSVDSYRQLKAHRPILTVASSLSELQNADAKLCSLQGTPYGSLERAHLLIGFPKTLSKTMLKFGVSPSFHPL
jgi:hypothetical protein